MVKNRGGKNIYPVRNQTYPGVVGGYEAGSVLDIT